MSNGWYTSTELEQQYGISKRLAYTWFDLLEKVDLARRAPGGKHGILLFLPGAKDFLVDRKKRYGKPRGKPSDGEMSIIAEAVMKETRIEEVAVALRASVIQTENWLRDFIAAN